MRMSTFFFAVLQYTEQAVCTLGHNDTILKRHAFHSGNLGVPQLTDPYTYFHPFEVICLVFRSRFGFRMIMAMFLFFCVCLVHVPGMCFLRKYVGPALYFNHGFRRHGPDLRTVQLHHTVQGHAGQ